MESWELKKEQLKLAPKIVLRDGFSAVRTVGGAVCASAKTGLVAGVVVCEWPSFKILETKTYFLPNPLPYLPGLEAYREMPALIEAYNQLEQEPDILLVQGTGIAHPRRIGIASHLGLILNVPTIGITEKLGWGAIQQGKIWQEQEIRGFEIKTREFSNPIYVSPGQLVTLGSSLDLISKSIRYPHKLPEPLHLAQKLVRKKTKEMSNNKDEPNHPQKRKSSLI